MKAKINNKLHQEQTTTKKIEIQKIPGPYCGRAKWASRVRHRRRDAQTLCLTISQKSARYSLLCIQNCRKTTV